MFEERSPRRDRIYDHPVRREPSFEVRERAEILVNLAKKLDNDNSIPDAFKKCGVVNLLADPNMPDLLNFEFPRPTPLDPNLFDILTSNRPDEVDPAPRDYREPDAMSNPGSSESEEEIHPNI